MDDFDLESLVHLEQTFYDVGFEDGFAHGRIHGLIEGRALGREKGFEMWEELGFYEGFALLWKAIVSAKHDGRPTDDRTVHHIKHLLELISQFPRVNPSPPPNGSPAAEVDIGKLMRQIRSRYKALCSTLGIRPSLRASTGPSSQRCASAQEDAATSSQRVWALDNGSKRPSNQDLSF